MDPSNYEAVLLFQTCAQQQTWNQFSGERLGLRMEAVTECLDRLERFGRIADPELAFDRVWEIDQIVNESVNATIRAAQAAKQQGNA